MKKTPEHSFPIETDQHRLPQFAFVDADNMKRSFDKALEYYEVTPEQRKLFSFPKLFQLRPHDRVYFYSAIEEDSELPEWLKEISAQPKFVLKLGTLTNKSGIRKQEGVDVKLAIDATRFAYSSTMKTCTLYGADGDFIPLVEAVSESGCFVKIISFNDPLKGRVAPKLQAESDGYEKINGPWIYETNLFPTTVRRSMERFHSFSPNNDRTEHKIHGETIEIEQLENDFLGMFGEKSPSSCYCCTDLDQLLIWAKMNFL